MTETVHPSFERSIGLLTVTGVALHFDIETRRRSENGRVGAIGRVGQRVSSVLAKKPGVFTRPVPIDRATLSRDVGFHDRTVAKAMGRLIDQGLLTVSGSRPARAVQLHLPEHVIATCRQYADRPRELPIDPPSRVELDEALAWLDR